MSMREASGNAHDLMELGWRKRREGDHDAALRHISEAERFCRESGAKRELADALAMLGALARDVREMETARAYYQEAVDISRGMNHPLQLAHKVRHLGDVHRQTGGLADAKACYDEALSLYQGNPAAAKGDVANALRSVALLAELNGDVGEAKRHWTRARELYVDVEIRSGVDECTQRLAMLDTEITRE